MSLEADQPRITLSYSIGGIDSYTSFVLILVGMTRDVDVPNSLNAYKYGDRGTLLYI